MRDLIVCLCLLNRKSHACVPVVVLPPPLLLLAREPLCRACLALPPPSPPHPTPAWPLHLLALTHPPPHSSPLQRTRWASSTATTSPHAACSQSSSSLPPRPTPRRCACSTVGGRVGGACAASATLSACVPGAPVFQELQPLQPPGFPPRPASLHTPCAACMACVGHSVADLLHPLLPLHDVQAPLPSACSSPSSSTLRPRAAASTRAGAAGERRPRCGCWGCCACCARRLSAEGVVRLLLPGICSRARTAAPTNQPCLPAHTRLPHHCYCGPVCVCVAGRCSMRRPPTAAPTSPA